MKSFLTKSAILTVAIGILFKPVIYPFMIGLKASKYDKEVGTLNIKTNLELHDSYNHKKVLIIGGTRGIGRGIALTMAKAGADITVVGRSAKNGNAMLALLSRHINNTQTIDYVQGDIGSVRTANECIKSLTEYATKNGKFDYLIVTAAIFPYWHDLINEDGLERSFGTAVIGRYMIYNNTQLLLHEKTARILNVLASGMDEYPFDRDLAAGTRTDGSLFEFVMNFASGAEMMQIGLGRRNEFYNELTKVSTHPGILKTDLHRGQGLIMDIIEGIMVKLIGFTEEEAGVNQASILSSSQLVGGRMNYIDEFLKGRLLGSKVPVDEDMDWLMNLIDEKVK